VELGPNSTVTGVMTDDFSVIDSVGSSDGTASANLKLNFVTITGTTFDMTGESGNASYEGTKNLYLTNTYISGSNDIIVGTNSEDEATQFWTSGTVVLD
jgi:hypothetical protein